MRITDSYCEDLAVIIIFFKSMQSSKTLISYTSEERRYHHWLFFKSRTGLHRYFKGLSTHRSKYQSRSGVLAFNYAFYI